MHQMTSKTTDGTIFESRLQIHPKTGVNCDYFNEFAIIGMVYPATSTPRKMSPLEEVTYTFRVWPVKTYEERFKDFSSVARAQLYTERAAPSIAMLNQLAAELNKLANAGTLSDKDVERIYLRARELIYGEREQWPPGSDGSATQRLWRSIEKCNQEGRPSTDSV